VADRRRGTALAVAALAVGGVALGGYLLLRDDDGPVDPWMPQGTAAVSPPPEDPDEDLALDTFAPIDAAVQITYSGPDEAAGGVVVGAYVAGLIEDGGRCAVTLSLDGTTAAAESDGTADASTTSCGQMLVPFDELSPGSWAVDVTYSSPSGGPVAAGRTTVEVP
jgi:hypothetical protein